MPWLTARKDSGVAQVLSISVTIPRALATATIAGTSCTSKVRLPGLSRKMARVRPVQSASLDRKSVVSGKSVSVSVDLGGRRIIKKKNIVSTQSMYQNTRDNNNTRQDNTRALTKHIE